MNDALAPTIARRVNLLSCVAIDPLRCPVCPMAWPAEPTRRSTAAAGHHRLASSSRPASRYPDVRPHLYSRMEAW